MSSTNKTYKEIIKKCNIDYKIYYKCDFNFKDVLKNEGFKWLQGYKLWYIDINKFTNEIYKKIEFEYKNFQDTYKVYDYCYYLDKKDFYKEYDEYSIEQNNILMESEKNFIFEIPEKEDTDEPRIIGYSTYITFCNEYKINTLYNSGKRKPMHKLAKKIYNYETKNNIKGLYYY